VNKIYVVLLLFLTLSGYSQTPHAINYGIADGLPSNNIYYVLQDRDNYLWFSTDVGVVRYNGREFIHYNTDDGLPDNEVFQMYQDSKGRIWFVTLNGKLGFYWNHMFYNEKNTPWLRNNILTNILVDIYDDAKSNVFITDRISGIYKLDADGKPSEIALYKYKSATGFNHILRLFSGDQNQTQLLTIGGIYTPDGRPVLKFPKKLIETSVIRSCILGDRVYFNSGNSIYQYHARKLEKLFSLPVDPMMIISVNAETKDIFWIGTRTGLYRVEKKQDGYVWRKFFDKLSVSHWMKDRDGNHWVTTLEEGVFMMPNLDVSIIDNLRNNKITVLSKDADNTLWAGSSDAYYYHFDKGGTATFEASLHGKNMIKDIVHSESKTIAIGNKGVSIRENAKQSAMPIGHNSLLVDRHGNYWLGGTIIAKLSPGQYKNLTPESISELYRKTLRLTKRTNKMILGKGDDIWIGTNFGLYKYSPRDSMQNYTAKLADINTSVEDLYFDEPKNRLIVATNSMGIIILENEKIVAHLGKHDNLSNNTCRSVCRAGQDSYWIGTNTGLDRVSLRHGKFTAGNFNSFAGLENGKVNDVVMIGDTLYLATDKGIVYFNPHRINRRKTNPVIHLTDFRVNSKSIPFGQTIRLESDQNELAIAYDGISFVENNKIKYYYILEGTDDKWYVTTSNQINYKALAPGDYTFKVYMKDSLGNPSATTQIRFYINKPFWKTIPFIVAFLLMSLALLFYIWKMRLAKLEHKFYLEKKAIQAERDKANLEREMIALEQKALRLQMNPHFIFNALNTIKGYYAEGNDIKASDYISKFSKLLRMLLENTEQLIPLSKEIEMLRLYIALTQIRYKNKFDFEMTVDPNLNLEDTAIPALLLQPMVENAIIHGLAPKKDKGLLQIEFHATGAQLICIVADNGIGRKASQKQDRDHVSKATEITRERIALLQNGTAFSMIAISDLADQNGEAAGTKVAISIPLTTIW
jgi:ligand-binding sensor domain-containing protein